MRSALVLVSSGMLAIALLPQTGAAQEGGEVWCEWCSFGECDAVQRPSEEDCNGNIYERNTCECFPVCNCNNADPCPACEGSANEEEQQQALQDVAPDLYTFSDGWELRGVWLDTGAFSVRAHCGASEGMIYSQAAAIERRNAARVLDFSPPLRSAFLQTLRRVFG